MSCIMTVVAPFVSLCMHNLCVYVVIACVSVHVYMHTCVCMSVHVNQL